MEVWIGVAIGIVTTVLVAMAVISIYVRVRGPFVVGPPDNPKGNT